MYDITIIGAGVSGIFTAYTLINNNNNLKILLIDKGNSLENRICPMEKEKAHICKNCIICSKYIGFGGMGKSEGKYNYTNDFGGNLEKLIGYEKVLNYMEEVDKILCKFGGNKAPFYSTENDILKNRVDKYKFKLLTTKTRHLGTKLSLDILKNMYEYLKEKINIRLNIEIEDINKENMFLIKTSENIYKSKNIVLATGLSGGKWFEKVCKTFGILPKNVRLDLGFRIEMNGTQLDSLLKDTFEIKLFYKGKDFEATTYCMNPQGRVIKKYQDGLVLADGENYLEKEKSENLNFTIFIPSYFKSNEEAKDYANKIIGRINKNKGRIIMQRLEDIKKQRQTLKEYMNKNSIIPTLKAEVENIYDKVPIKYIKGTLEFLNKLECLIGEKIHPDTILYALDAKFYQPEIDVNRCFETKIKGLYLIGDCSGVTYSLSQAAASGVYLGHIFPLKLL